MPLNPEKVLHANATPVTGAGQRNSDGPAVYSVGMP